MSPPFQTIQALDDMLQALVMEDMSPNMVILQSYRNQNATLFPVLYAR